jgi:hypothetical protein
LVISRKVLGIVWAETARLEPVGGSAATKSRLQAVVGGLAQRDDERGSTENYARPSALPEAATLGGDAAEAMRSAIETAVASQQYAGAALPGRAVVWEVTNTGEPRESERPLPKWAQWIKEAPATRTSDFNVAGDSTGRVFRLFESDAATPVSGVAFVSGFTGSGVPEPLAKINYLSLPWIVGIGATVLFIWMMIVLAWTGHAATQARDLMFGTQPEYTSRVATTVFDICAPGPEGSLPGTPATSWMPDCTGAGAPAEGTPQFGDIAPAMKACVTDKGDANNPPLMSRSAFCRLAWRQAAEEANSAKMTNLPGPFGNVFVFISGWFAKASPTTGSLSLALPMTLLLLGIALLVVALGLGQKGRVFGVWISPENRMSLARMQVSLWTIVVLGAYAAMALFNIGMLSEPLRIESMLAGAATDPSIRKTAEEAVAKLVTFPSIPAMILAALGIAAASSMLSALIKSGTGKGPSVDVQDDAQKKGKSGIGRFIDPTSGGTLERRPTAQYASLADFFMGELESDRHLIDVSRLQNVVITVILVAGYATLLFGFVRDIAPDTIVGALRDNASVFPGLPNPGGIFTTLLAASHATYLIAKRATTDTPAADGDKPK